MDWPRVDYHTHICVHPIDGMLERAAVVGVREYGISEHIFQLDEGRGIFPAIPEEGRRFSRDEYVGMVADARDRSGLRVRLGLEVDFVPGTEVAVRAVLDGVNWDYLIGSIHQIGERDIFEYTPSTPSECHDLWRRYYQLFIDAASSGLFDILSHPARNSLLNSHLPDDIDELLGDIASVASANDVALELNGEDVSRWPSLVEKVANACGRAGCFMSLGSDAHEPGNVGRGLALATEIAVRAGVPGIVSFEGRERRILSLR